MNIKNIRPPECPDDAPLTAEERAELRRYLAIVEMLQSLTPEQLDELEIAVNEAEALQEAGRTDDEIVAYLQSKYGPTRTGLKE